MAILNHRHALILLRTGRRRPPRSLKEKRKEMDPTLLLLYHYYSSCPLINLRLLSASTSPRIIHAEREKKGKKFGE
jgi:hypothetical protein